MNFSLDDDADRRSNVLATRGTIGAVRVDISSLSFPRGRSLQPERVNYLINLFQDTRCRRHNPAHYIVVLISLQDLKVALKASGLLRRDLTVPAQDGKLCLLKTAENQKLTCVFGKHRIEAAKEFLAFNDQWWVIKLCLFESKNDFDDLFARWKDGFSHEIQDSDGEIYRNIRLIQIYEAGSIDAEARVDELTARLSKCKQVALKQLLGHSGYRKKFDKLLHFPGHWAGLELGNIQRHCAMKTDEEGIRFLKRVDCIWTSMTLGSKHIAQCADVQTVEALQLRAPGVSKVDRDFVVQAMKDDYLFPEITDATTRRLLTESILSIKCLIPSIKTLHENMKYLETGAKILKSLILGGHSRNTLFISLQAAWTQPEHMIVETAGGEIRAIDGEISTALRWDLTYKQIWMLVLRRCAELGGRGPRKENGRKIYKAHENPIVRNQTLKFARDLGFDIAGEAPGGDPRKHYFQDSIAQIFDLQPSELEKVVEDMLQRIPIETRAASTTFQSLRAPPKSTMSDLGRRCGFPYEYTYNIRKCIFYLPEIFDGDAESLNESFVQRDFFEAFFGPTSAIQVSKVPHEEFRSQRVRPRISSNFTRAEPTLGELQVEHSLRSAGMASSAGNEQPFSSNNSQPMPLSTRSQSITGLVVTEMTGALLSSSSEDLNHPVDPARSPILTSFIEMTRPARSPILTPFTPPYPEMTWLGSSSGDEPDLPIEYNRSPILSITSSETNEASQDPSRDQAELQQHSKVYQEETTNTISPQAQDLVIYNLPQEPQRSPAMRESLLSLTQELSRNQAQFQQQDEVYQDQTTAAISSQAQDLITYSLPQEPQRSPAMRESLLSLTAGRSEETDVFVAAPADSLTLPSLNIVQQSIVSLEHNRPQVSNQPLLEASAESHDLILPPEKPRSAGTSLFLPNTQPLSPKDTQPLEGSNPLMSTSYPLPPLVQLERMSLPPEKSRSTTSSWSSQLTGSMLISTSSPNTQTNKSLSRLSPMEGLERFPNPEQRDIVMESPNLPPALPSSGTYKPIVLPLEPRRSAVAYTDTLALDPRSLREDLTGSSIGNYTEQFELPAESRRSFMEIPPQASKSANRTFIDSQSPTNPFNTASASGNMEIDLPEPLPAPDQMSIDDTPSQLESTQTDIVMEQSSTSMDIGIEQSSTPMTIDSHYETTARCIPTTSSSQQDPKVRTTTIEETQGIEEVHSLTHTYAFCEWNSMFLKPIVKQSYEQMDNYLRHRQGWIWFRPNRGTWESVPAYKVVESITRYSTRSHCVMPKHQSLWFLENHKQFFTDGKPIDTKPRKSTTEIDSLLHLVTKSKLLDKEWCLNECEIEQENARQLLCATEACLLSYESRTDRSLIFCQSKSALSDEVLRVMSRKFEFRVVFGTLSRVEVNEARIDAQSHPVWLIPKDQLQIFESQWHEQRQQREAEPVPPIVGDSYEEASLFSDEDSYITAEYESPAPDSRHSSNTIPQAMPLIEGRQQRVLPAPENSGKGIGSPSASLSTEISGPLVIIKETSIAADHRLLAIEGKRDCSPKFLDQGQQNALPAAESSLKLLEPAPSLTKASEADNSLSSTDKAVVRVHKIAEGNNGSLALQLSTNDDPILLSTNSSQAVQHQSLAQRVPPELLQVRRTKRRGDDLIGPAEVAEIRRPRVILPRKRVKHERDIEDEMMLENDE